mmetsp:Transcript_7854/g.19387  ORF Transcript_7854/g.19387 Transcript_7854/m.19387 type:complete len:163 (+) Transcript_7854:108-596(+)
MAQFVPVDEVPENATHTIVGFCSLTVIGLAPRERIQNMRGDENEWTPPFNLGNLTYTYIENDASVAATAERYAAQLETERVHVDGDREAHFIYHADGQHLQIAAIGTIPCMKVFTIVGRNNSIKWAGSKWLKLVYMPENMEANHFLQNSLLREATLVDAAQV